MFLNQKRLNYKMKEAYIFLILSSLGLLLLNITLIGAFLVLAQYGSVTLSPGENYTINIPFSGITKLSIICGKAETSNGEIVQGVKITIRYKNESVGKNTTNSKGKYCITLPKVNSNREYDIFIEYNNEINRLGSNDYTLDFKNNLTFNKSSNKYVVLNGSIINEDAEIENGRFEINLQYWPQNSSNRYEVFDYQKYL
ncbi:MAG: hypothetical protein AABY22_17790 [Nanoarchaeota archaeon]